MTGRYRSAQRWFSLHANAQFVPAVSMSGLVLTLVSVLSVALGAWRLGVDPGWTGAFFIPHGLLSRYQLWFALGIGAQASAFILNRWVANRNISPALVRCGNNPMITVLELTDFRSVLEARQAELEDLLRDRGVIAVNSSADMLDQIQHTLERDMAIGNLERGSARLREVQGALERLDRGTFGICIDCAEEIGEKRLVAVPWTTSCLTCREAEAQNGIGSPLLNVA
jgi:DnaK suppressor protein